MLSKNAILSRTWYHFYRHRLLRHRREVNVCVKDSPFPPIHTHGVYKHFIWGCYYCQSACFPTAAAFANWKFRGGLDPGDGGNFIRFPNLPLLHLLPSTHKCHQLSFRATDSCSLRLLLISARQTESATAKVCRKEDEYTEEAFSKVIKFPIPPGGAKVAQFSSREQDDDDDTHMCHEAFHSISLHHYKLYRIIKMPKIIIVIIIGLYLYLVSEQHPASVGDTLCDTKFPIARTCGKPDDLRSR